MPFSAKIDETVARAHQAATDKDMDTDTEADMVEGPDSGSELRKRRQRRKRGIRSWR